MSTILLPRIRIQCASIFFAEETLNAGITIGAANLNAAALFELVNGADPYFTNVDLTKEPENICRIIIRGQTA